MGAESLLQRRCEIENQWDLFRSGSAACAASNINHDILSSWQRSSNLVGEGKATIPLIDDERTQSRWKDSSLREAILSEQNNLKQLTSDGDMVAAVADNSGRLIWSTSGNYMRSRAEEVNFRAGGCWSEQVVGTNAVGLALKLLKPVTVFSSEHYLPEVHEWVCYAAPIIHPETGLCLGVLDISTTWSRHTPLGQAAVSGIATAMASNLPTIQPKAELELHLLGQPRVIFRGEKLNLSLRQLEILCLLALNPQGMSLDRLHASLYGDARVSTSTLKAELSRLRRRLDGRIDSRPYRLTMPVWADFTEIWDALKAGDEDQALGLYHGSFIRQSVSPELEEWRCCIDAVMTRVLNNCDDVESLVRQLGNGFNGDEIIRDRLSEILS